MVILIKRKSINFTNIKINPVKQKKIAAVGNKSGNKRDDMEKMRNAQKARQAKAMLGLKKKPFYHISNFTASYGYNEVFIRNINTDHNLLRQHSGGIAYNFNNTPKSIQPLKKIKSKLLRSKPLKIVRDINFYYTPVLVAFRNDLNKSYNEIELRNIDNPDVLIKPNFDKQFTWQRSYDVKYKLSRGITIDYSATNSAWVDEPYGSIDKGEDDWQEKRDTIWRNLADFGRSTKFNQEIRTAWRVPVNKLPGMDWTSLDVKYGARYDWELGPKTLLDDGTEEYLLGNNIMNSQRIEISPRFQLGRLYKKVNFK